MTPKSRGAAFAFQIPHFLYFTLLVPIVATLLVRVWVRYSLDTNEGWNAYWAAAAWSGGTLYPEPLSLKLNNYLPLWFYTTGTLGALLGDNICLLAEVSGLRGQSAA